MVNSEVPKIDIGTARLQGSCARLGLVAGKVQVAELRALGADVGKVDSPVC